MGRGSRRVAIVILAGAFGTATLASTHLSSQDSQQTQPDNTKKNRDQTTPNADQQKTNPTDRDIAQKIRKSIVDDKSLSTYAHNVKIIAQDGKVTLRGPVRSDEEKATVEAKAAEVVGQGNLSSQIEVKPSK